MCLFYASFGEFGRKEQIQVEFIELTLLSNTTNSVRNAVGHHDHSGQSGIGVSGANPFSLSFLLVRIRPVEYLFFDKLAAVDGAEGRAGKVQIVRGCDRQPAFIDGIICFLFLVLFHVEVGILFVIRRFKELLGILTPCAEMVLIEDDQIPVDVVDKLILSLDAARIICAQ